MPAATRCRPLLDAGGVARVALGPFHVVVAPGHDALGEEAATRLAGGDGTPAAVGVGGEVADGVEQADAVGGVDFGAGPHVLLDVGVRVRILQVGHRRRGEHGPAGDVV